jgi:mono/diheme cytochrome c family protein
MTGSARRLLTAGSARARGRVVLLAAAAGLAGGVSACGEHGIQLSASDPNYKGAEIFANHCSGCHTLNVVGTQGSASNVRSREYKDGPNFDQRKEQVSDVLYAIRNGGFSSGPMPQDIVTGSSADRVARFVAKYSGNRASRTTQPSQPPVAGAAKNSAP